MKMINTAIIAASLMLAATSATAGDTAVGKTAGDAAAGEATYNSKGCSGCHGAGGHSAIPTNPVLAGKGAEFIQKQLADFKSGARSNPTMNAMAAMLNDDDVANVAAYLGEQK